MTKREALDVDFPGFDACVQMLRQPDPFTQEDGFHWLLPYADRYVDELMGAFQEERDPDVRSMLLELLGEARSPKTFPVLVDCLRGDNADLRMWATWGLKYLGTEEARAVLYEAALYTFTTEEETAIFRDNLEYILNDQPLGTGDLSPVPPELGARGPSCL